MTKRGPTSVVWHTLTWAVLLLGVLTAACESRKPSLELGGGPLGGTAQSFAMALGRLINQELPDVRVEVEHSSGSVENLVAVEEGEMLALVHAEDAYLGDVGQLPRHPMPTKNVLAMGRMYGSVAQLVVPRGSPFQTPYDLRKVRVAIGNPSSSSAQSAERYFRSLDLWTQIIPIYVSDVRGLKELVLGSVDAVWTLTDVPNREVVETDRVFPVRLLDLWEKTAIGAFFQSYPYYSLTSIPAGSYPGQSQEIYTIESPMLLVANRSLDTQLAYRLMQIIFSAQGKARLQEMHPAARELDVRRAIGGVNISYHPGALKYLNEYL